MNESKHPRAVVGLILLAILCTVALGLQERRSAPLVAYSPASPQEGGSPGSGDAVRGRPLPETFRAVWNAFKQVGRREFWLRPWPWVVVGLAGFGALAWGVRRMERE